MFNERNPKLVKGLGTGLAVTGGVLLITPAVLIGGLGLLGFSAIGPVAGAFLSNITNITQLIFAFYTTTALGSIAAGIQGSVMYINYPRNNQLLQCRVLYTSGVTNPRA